ncbi:phage head closure protein [Paracoccus rhizosphaerae]|uniref:Phage head closure protein n=1 Tax=Paracoccus rhizosphaerae TaxID=1133347 RepID=A0ABV6CDT3_9RHOB|nr:phage head closure protein [Paracoccus rhizosphaerae]
MKAGKLTETIVLQSGGTTLNDYGTPIPDSNVTLAVVRAERIDQTTEEFLRAGGATDEESVIFRIRHLDGIGNDDRVIWEGQTFNIRQVTPIGRRKGLDLRCTRQLA